MGSAQSSHAKGTKKTMKKPAGARGRTEIETSTPETPKLTVEELVGEQVLVVKATPVVISDTESELDEEESAVASAYFEDESDEGEY